MKTLKYLLLFFFPIFLYSQDLDFYKQFVQPQYDLAKNYGKGCLLKSKDRQNFMEAKRFLKKLYIVHHPITFYCGCRIVYSKSQERLIPDPSCGYKKKSPSTEFMINWEHIMPAHRFGKDRECWQSRVCTKEKNGKIKKFKGRNCCNEIDDCFNIMEGDVHNLVPTIYELNRDRKNYFFGEIPGEPREYGSCDFEVDHRRNIAEPRDSIRGDIARTYLYMSWFYGIPLTQEEIIFIQKWNKLDPPDEEEKKINRLKAQYQGNENPFISYYQ
jgi:deoxyribonuclease-1